MDDLMQSRMDQLLDHIMKKCLWQFHSRSWDRKIQNEGVLSKTTQILCGEPVDTSTPLAKCHWVDAQCLVDDYKRRFPWITAMDKNDIKAMMQALHQRLDHLTITGSLNLELNDQHY